MTSGVTIVNGISGDVITEVQFDDTTLVCDAMTAIRKAVGGLRDCCLLAKERQLPPTGDVSQAVIEGEGQLTAILCDLGDLKENADRGTLAHLMLCGYSVQEVMAAGFSQLFLMDLTSCFDMLQQLRKGFSARELIDASFSPEQFICCNRYHIARKLKAVGYDAQRLKLAGYSARELSAGFNDPLFNACELREAGFGLQELKTAGYNVQQLKAAGFNAKEFKDSGFSCMQLREAGVLMYQPKEACFDGCAMLSFRFLSRKLALMRQP